MRVTWRGRAGRARVSVVLHTRPARESGGYEAQDDLAALLLLLGELAEVLFVDLRAERGTSEMRV